LVNDDYLNAGILPNVAAGTAEQILWVQMGQSRKEQVSLEAECLQDLQASLSL